MIESIPRRLLVGYLVFYASGDGILMCLSLEKYHRGGGGARGFQEGYGIGLSSSVCGNNNNILNIYIIMEWSNLVHFTRRSAKKQVCT